MKTISKLATVAVLAATVTAVQAEAVTSRSVFVGATVIKPLALTQTTPLFFGTFSAGTTAGTVDHFGQTTGGVVYQSGAQPGVFHITGEPNINVNITSSTTALLTNTANPAQTMTATIAVPPATVLTGAGDQDFNSTGSLAVAANQPSGSYTGAYTVTVSY